MNCYKMPFTKKIGVTSGRECFFSQSTISNLKQETEILEIMEEPVRLLYVISCELCPAFNSSHIQHAVVAHRRSVQLGKLSEVS